MCLTTWAGAACCRSWSKAARPSPSRSIAARLVDRYVLYLAPALMGGDDGAPLFRGPGAADIADVWRGRLSDVHRLGDDLRIDLAPAG